jgi:hypothetical protein
VGSAAFFGSAGTQGPRIFKPADLPRFQTGANNSLEKTCETSMLSVLHRVFRCRLIFLAVINLIISIIELTHNQPIFTIILSFVISMGALFVFCKAITDRFIVTNQRAYAEASNPVGYRLNVIAVGVLYLVISCVPLFLWFFKGHN